MNLELHEAVLIIDHEVERLKSLFDYKEFLILNLAVEELDRLLIDDEETKEI